MDSNEEINKEEIMNDLRDGILKLYQDGKWQWQEYKVMMNHAVKLSTTNISDVRDEYGLIGGELYEQIKEVLQEHFDKLKKIVVDNTDEVDILTFFVNEWKSYKYASYILNKACTYLNDTWILRNNEMGRLDIYKISDLALVFWKDNILEHFHIPVVNGALKLIERERNGLSVDSSLVLHLTKCIVAVNLKQDGSTDITSYKDKFERLFLEETERFYNEEGTCYLQNNRVTEYVKNVERRLDEEQKRLQENLHESTKEILIKTCERSLIQRHLQTFCDEFKELLVLDKNEDIERMFLLVARNPEDLKGLITLFYKHVLLQGLSAIKTNCKSSPNDAKMYGTTILTVYNKYVALVFNVFKQHKEFVKVLNNAIGQFLNKNEVATSAKSSELLAQYSDILLRKLNQKMKISELENNFKFVMELYNLLENKDVFENHYLRLFTKRLTHNTTIGYDVENLMISTMESKVSFTTYTIELKRMLDEIKKSTNLTQEFRTYLTDSAESASVDIELNFKVLSQYLWKIKQSPTICFLDQFEVYVTKFISFYTKNNSKRKLNLCRNLCNGVIVTKRFQNMYTIEANSVQISILLQYNISSNWTLSELVNQTKIEIEYLLPSLQALIKKGFLICNDSEKHLKPSSLICLNKVYNNNKSYVNVNVPIKRAIQQTGEMDKIEENRRNFIIQSNIMLVLKKHQVMKHQELINHVSNRISLFKFNIQSFKKCIDILIKREYLERTSDTYKYLP